MEIEEAQQIMSEAAGRLDAIANELDSVLMGAGAKIFAETAHLHNAVKEIGASYLSANAELQASYAAKRKGTDPVKEEIAILEARLDYLDAEPDEDPEADEWNWIAGRIKELKGK